jgi:hypothetical protein
MAIKYFKIFFALLIVSVLQSCPSIGEEVCDSTEASANIPDLITIIPLKQTYSQGEEITYKLVIPSENNYFGNPVNLYQKTGVIQAWLIGNSALFNQNGVTYIKGSKRDGADNWFNVAYNASNGSYELEIKVKLNTVGNYSFITAERIDFLGSDKCNKNFIYTNIQGKNANQMIEFTVQ